MQALPICIPSTFFKQYSLRLRHNQLMLHKRYRGLAVPDVRKYYQVIHLSRLINWNRHTDLKLWVRIEQGQSIVPLGRASWCFASLPREVKKHPLIGHKARLCSTLLTLTPILSTTSPLFPILGNPLFHETAWGCFSKPMELRPRTSLSFHNLRGMVDYFAVSWPNGQLPPGFLEHSPVYSFCSIPPAPRHFDRPLTSFEEFCADSGAMLSANYDLLNTPTEPHSLGCISDWEEDLGT